MSEVTRDEVGVIVGLLLAEGVVSEEQVAYARRIQSKLHEPGPLLAVLQEMGAVDEDQIRAALTRRRLDVRIGDLLLELAVLQPQDLQLALEILEADSDKTKKLGDILIQHRFVEEGRLTEILAYQLGFELVEPTLASLDRTLLARTTPAWMAKGEFLPLRSEAQGIVVAFSDPTNPVHIEAAETVFSEGVIPAIAPRSTIRDLLGKLDGRGRLSLEGPVNEATVGEMVDSILDAAVEEGASDIHMEPLSDRLRVRFRCDGVLILHREFPLELLRPLSSRIKVICKADIAERRRHQDARLFYERNGRELDMRVSIYVTVHGEKIVLRLLNRERQVQNLSQIGMAPRMLERFLEGALSRPSGVILVTGPTGSGKTSTLYSCISHINSPDTSIISAEDPVECVIDGIAQCSIDAAHDRGFDATLKQIVRQDPDIIVIGEIRDPFSAETAIQAALTGHKVLTTFHTEDTIGGLVRLLNMEIEAFLVSSTVVSVLAQRLLRRVCPSCSSPHHVTPADLRMLGYRGPELEGVDLRFGRGCEACHHTGYSGRVAVFELLVLGEEVRAAVLQQQTSHEIRRLARESSGMVSLLEDGICKAAAGQTTVSEIGRMLPNLDKPRPVAELKRLLGV